MKKIQVIIAFVLIVVIVGTTVGYQIICAKTEDTEEINEHSGKEAEVTTEEDSETFSCEGTTGMGVTSQLPAFSVSAAVMYVEEVYVAAGDTVAQGDALYKISEESINEAKEYYADAIEAAKDTLAEAEMEYLAGELEATYEKTDLESDATNAATVLSVALQEIEDDITEKYENWQEALEDIDTYTYNISNNVYYTEAGIEEKTENTEAARLACETAKVSYEEAKNTYEEAKEELKAYVQALNTAISLTEASEATVEEKETTISKTAMEESGTTENIQNLNDIATLAEAVVTSYEKVENTLLAYETEHANYESAEENLKKAEEDLEKAEEEYQRNLENANTSLTQLEESVDGLQLSYEKACREAESKCLEVKEEYDTTILEGQYSDTSYSEFVSPLEEAVKEAEETLENLQEEQNNLLALTDGIICAETSGTLASVTYEAEDVLMSQGVLVTYYNTAVISVEVEVDQSDIANLSVGDNATVEIASGRRNSITGVVDSIASSATTGGSVSDVTYTVEQELTLEATSSGSSSGQSANTMTGQMSGASSSGSSSSGSNSVSLEVEEVYISVGQNVAVGDPLLKISEESIEDYRDVLEDAVSDASADLSEAKLSAQKQQLSATYSYESSIAEGTVAEATYNATINQLQSEIDDALEALEEQAKEVDYLWNLVNDGDSSYAEELEDAQEKYVDLQDKLTTAQNNYTTKSIEAKKEYEETMLAYSNADGQYSVDVNGIDRDVESASEALEEAKAALEEFEAFIGDGIVYAEYEGSVMSVGYAQGDELSTDTVIATYSDATAVTITVSVSQEDISEVAVGDTVLIELTAYEDEDFSGIVSSMDTSTSSGSSTVSYNVTVTFQGDISKVYADMTGNVTFIQKQVTDVLYVSNKAIINEGTSSYVKRMAEDGSFVKEQVITGFSDGVNVEIQSGLDEGDTVIIESRVVNE